MNIFKCIKKRSVLSKNFSFSKKFLCSFNFRFLRELKKDLGSKNLNLFLQKHLKKKSGVDLKNQI